LQEAEIVTRPPLVLTALIVYCGILEAPRICPSLANPANGPSPATSPTLPAKAHELPQNKYMLH
jgi:hypothetical protein